MGIKCLLMESEVPSAADRSAREIGSSFGGSRLTGCFGAKFLGSATWSDIVICADSSKGLSRVFLRIIEA